MKNKLCTLITFLLGMILCTTPVFGEELDPSKRGTLTIVQQDSSHNPIGGGKITVYQVGYLDMSDPNNPKWKLTDDFKQTNVDLSDPQNRNVTANLADFAAKNAVVGKTYTVPASGRIILENILPGLYMVEQNQAPDGYYPFATYTMSFPQEDEDGGYNYEVVSGPKTTSTKTTTPPPGDDTPPPDQPNTPNNPNKPDTDGTVTPPTTGTTTTIITTEPPTQTTTTTTTTLRKPNTATEVRLWTWTGIAILSGLFLFLIVRRLRENYE